LSESKSSMRNGKIVVVDEGEEFLSLKDNLSIMLDSNSDLQIQKEKTIFIDFESSNPKNLNKKLPCFAKCISKTKTSYANSSLTNIYVSSLFIQTYNLSNNEIVNFEIVENPIPLKSVLMIPKDSKSKIFSSKGFFLFDLTKKENNFKEKLTESTSCLNNETIIHISEATFYVADTNPTSRGIITKDTSVLILNDFSLFPKEQEPSIESFEYKPQFLCNSLFISNKKLFFDSKNLNVKINVMKDSRFFNYLSKFSVDPLSIGIVSLKTLRKLNCFSGTWVNLSLPNQPGKCLYLVSISMNLNEEFEIFV
jgi:hypothetical protein